MRIRREREKDGASSSCISKLVTEIVLDTLKG